MKQIIGSVVAIAGIALFVANGARASDLAKAAQILDQQSRAGKGEFITYLTGAAAAYRWAAANSGSIYCPPLNASVDGRAYATIALEEYQRRKAEYAGLHDFPLNVLALALMRGLQEKYPCRSEAQAPSVRLQ